MCPYLAIFKTEVDSDTHDILCWSVADFRGLNLFNYFAATVSLTPISGTLRPTTAAICLTCFISSSN